jgi:hypothetical protein
MGESNGGGREATRPFGRVQAELCPAVVMSEANYEPSGRFLPQNRSTNYPEHVMFDSLILYFGILLPWNVFYPLNQTERR